MSFEADTISIRNEIERARLAWSAYSLVVEYSNKSNLDLAKQLQPYVMADVVWYDGTQLDLGSRPMVQDMGQIILACGVKEGTGSIMAERLRDHFRPYLQLRDNLGNVRTHAAQAQKPVTVKGFEYYPLVIGFWSVSLSLPVP
jgi:hypothetical protein